MYIIHLLSINVESSRILTSIWTDPKLEELFNKFVNDFADGFIEAIPVSATLGITGAGFGKTINYASYKYDKVKTKRASDIYGIDFEGQKVNNEFSTVENNAFSDEKYKLVNKDIFNINPSKMSKEGKKIYN